MFVFVDNKLVPSEQAAVSVFDHGFLYGDGVYETLRTYNGVIFKLDAHLRRLKKSSSLINLSLPYSFKEMKAILYDTICANKLTEAYIRITLTRGKGAVGLDPSLCPKPSLVVIANQLKPYPVEIYNKGIKSIISRVRRNLIEAVNPEIKSLNFLNNIMAKIEAKKSGAFEAIMLNHKGYVAEGTVSNIFMVKGGSLATPSLDTGILNGITRQTVLRIAQKRNIKIVLKKIRPGDFYNADEVFLTNTTLEIVPVRQLDHAKYKKRDMTEILRAEYKKEVQRETKKKQ